MNDPPRDDRRITRLLGLGRGDVPPAVAELLGLLRAARLRAGEGGLDECWAALLADGAPGARSDPRAFYLAFADAADLARAYRDSKRILRDATCLEQRAAGFLGLLLALAAAWVLDRTWRSSEPKSEIDPIFLELAGESPPPWDDLFAAALRETA